MRDKSIVYSSEDSWSEAPTTAQVRSIMRAARILRLDITEPGMPTNRWEARRLQWILWNKVKNK